MLSRLMLHTGVSRVGEGVERSIQEAKGNISV